jgi:haloalkane dehalogenase
MHYLDEGPREGDAVVMVHGNPSWSFFYRALASAIRDGYRVIVPDHIGMGLSDKPSDRQYDYTLASRVRDLERLLDHLGVNRGITLVVHDWGGMIGMTYAAWYPDRIGRIVVLNTAAFHLPRGKRVPWQLRLSRVPWVGAFLVRGLNGFCRYAARRCVARGPMPPDVRAAYLAPYGSWRNRRAVLRFVQDIPLRPGDRAHDLVTHVEINLNRFGSVPRLICWGMKDFVFDGDYLDRWIEFWPDVEVLRFDDAGHYVLEDAGEEIGTILRRFLDDHPL